MYPKSFSSQTSGRRKPTWNWLTWIQLKPTVKMEVLLVALMIRGVLVKMIIQMVPTAWKFNAKLNTNSACK